MRKLENRHHLGIFFVGLLLIVTSIVHSAVVNVSDREITADGVSMMNFDEAWFSADNASFANNITVDGRVLDTTDFDTWDAGAAGNDGYFLNGTIQTSNGGSYPATGAGLQSAIDNLTGGGKVYVPNGYIATSVNITIQNNVTVIGTGSGSRTGTSINSGINLSENATIIVRYGKLHDMRINADDGWNGDYALIVEGYPQGWNRHELLKNVNVDNLATGRTGTGIYFKAIGDDSPDCIALSHFGPFSVRGFILGVKFYAEDSSNGAYINGNKFDYITIDDCTYGLNISATDSAQIVHNTFDCIDIQPVDNAVSGKTVRGILVDGSEPDSGYGNQFLLVNFWDWGSRATGYKFNFTNANNTYIRAGISIDSDEYYIDDSNVGIYDISGNNFVTKGFVYTDTLHINKTEWSGDDWVIYQNANDDTNDYGLVFRRGGNQYAAFKDISGGSTYFNTLYEDIDFLLRGTNGDDTFLLNAGQNKVAITNLTVTDNVTLTNGAYIDGRFINTTDFTSWDSSGSADGYAYDGKIHNSNGHNWTATGANIQNAIDDLSSGGTVWLPSGTIDISGVNLSLDDGISLVGAGINSTVLYHNQEWVSGQSLEGIQIIAKENVTLKGFTLDMNEKGNGTIFVTDASKNIWIEDLSLVNPAGNAIYTSDEVHNIHIHNIHVQMGTDTEAHGLALAYLYDCVVSDILVENYDHDASECGIDLINSENVTLTNIRVVGNGWHDGIKCSGNEYVTWSNVIISDAYDNSFIFGTNPNYHCSLSDFAFYNPGNALQVHTGCNDITISNGRVVGGCSGQNQMTIYGQNVSVSNVELRDAVDEGLVIQSASKNVQLNNVRVLNAGSYNKMYSASNVIISDSIFSYGGNMGLSIDGASHFKIMNCIFEGNAGDAIDTTISACNNYTIMGCTFLNNAQGIDTHASDDYNIITLNHFIGDTLDDHSATKGHVANNIGDDI